jgi:hypothetical protein
MLFYIFERGPAHPCPPDPSYVVLNLPLSPSSCTGYYVLSSAEQSHAHENRRVVAIAAHMAESATVAGAHHDFDILRIVIEHVVSSHLPRPLDLLSRVQ